MGVGGRVKAGCCCCCFMLVLLVGEERGCDTYPCCCCCCCWVLLEVGMVRGEGGDRIMPAAEPGRLEAEDGREREEGPEGGYWDEDEEEWGGGPEGGSPSPV